MPSQEETRKDSFERRAAIVPFPIRPRLADAARPALWAELLAARARLQAEFSDPAAPRLTLDAMRAYVAAADRYAAAGNEKGPDAV